MDIRHIGTPKAWGILLFLWITATALTIAYSVKYHKANNVCMDMNDIHLGPFEGGFSSRWLGPAKRGFCLPSHRLVGELAHPIELLLHPVISALTPMGGNIPGYFSQCKGPCSKEAQHKIQSPIFSFPHRRLPTPRTHPAITYFQMVILHLHLPHCLRRDAGPIHRGHSRAERATAVTSSGCAAMHYGKCSIASLVVNVESTNVGIKCGWDLI